MVDTKFKHVWGGIQKQIIFTEWLYARQPGTWSLNSKCPALKKLRLQVPGTWNKNSKCPTLQKLGLQVPVNVNCKCPSLQKLKLQVLGTWYENFKCLHFES